MPVNLSNGKFGNGTVRKKHRTGSKTLLGFVSSKLDGYLPPQAMRFTDAADNDTHDYLVWSALGDIEEVDTHAATLIECGHDRAQRGRGAAGSTDHPTHVLRMYPNVKAFAPTLLTLTDEDITWIIDDTAN